MKNLTEKEKSSAVKENNVKWSDLFWLFMVGNVSGVIIEGIISLFAKGHWENHVTLLWGPFNLVYGLAAVFIYLVSDKLKKHSNTFKFIFFTVICSSLELAVAVLQEKVLNSVSWNYSNLPFNFFGGRLCLFFSFGWGLLGIFFARFVFVPLDHILKKNIAHKLERLTLTFAIFMAVNIVFSTAVLFRWTHRAAYPEPRNSFEVFTDKRYTDEFMQHRFCEWVILNEN
ncbi:MAG: putative ABC transporter permease [Clostridia bacterium]|nr:putative ABC transporter permease [Clostridia bacterium]